MFPHNRESSRKSMAIQKSKLANCTPHDVFSMIRKIGPTDFEIIDGGKHTKIKHIATGKKTTIPRKNRVNSYLLKDVIEDFLVKELGYSEEEIYKNLKC